MFFRTQLKTIGAGGAIDMQGRRLSFIGYLPVKAGDWVFTDGNIIFGNSPPKGSPTPAAEQPGGIPVLSENLRGYFSANGKYKKYGVKGDDWITNEKKKYAHDGEGIVGTEIDGQRIIDAGISDNGDIYLVTDGLYLENHAVKYNHHIFIQYQNSISEPNNEKYWVLIYTEALIGEEVTLGVEADPVDFSAVIYKNGEQTDEFNLKVFADMVETKSLEARAEIMRRSANKDEDGNFLPEPPEGTNWIKQPPPPDSFVAAKSARVLTFKTDQQGNWDAIVTASAYGYCFPFLYLNGSPLKSMFDSATPKWNAYLAECLYVLELNLFRSKYYPFLNVEKYPSFTGTTSIDGYYTWDYAHYCEDAMAYYIPLVRFKHFEWFPVTFGASMLFHVRNGKVVTVMQSRCGGGNAVNAYDSWDETKILSKGYNSAFELNTTLEENDWRFPVGDKIFLGGFGSELKGLFDTEGKKLTDVPQLNQRIHFEPAYPFFVSAHEDAVAQELYKVGAVDINKVHNNLVVFLVPYYFYQEDDVTYLVTNSPDEIFSADALKPYRFLNEFFDEKVTTDVNRDGLFRFNPSCAKLQGGKFLFGVYGEKLYLKNADGWQEADDCLKNFRLLELKQISKARK